MGHVDDAHEAERDRKAECDHQQDRAEAKAAKEGAEEVDPGDVAIDLGERMLGGFDLVRGRRFVLHHRPRTSRAGDRGVIAEQLDGGDLDGWVGVLELDDCDGIRQCLP